VCEVGHDGEARVGFGREVMAQKKLVTHFPNEEKRTHPLKKKKRKKKRGARRGGKGARQRERERERGGEWGRGERTERGIRTRAGWTSILCLPACSQFRNTLLSRATEPRVAAFFPLAFCGMVHQGVQGVSAISGHGFFRGISR